MSCGGSGPDWATLREEIDKVDLSSPHVRYHMGERTNNPEAPSDYLDVTALSGLIEEGNSRITLRGDVRAEHDANILTGPEAVFLNNTRILTFPEGADLNGPTLSGTAKLLRWNVSTNILEGEGGVSMTWTPRDDAGPLRAFRSGTASFLTRSRGRYSRASKGSDTVKTFLGSCLLALTLAAASAPAFAASSPSGGERFKSSRSA